PHEPSVKDIEELTQRISGFFGSNAIVVFMAPSES
ncbi:unnamed protein product, partial [marine sediment metagenome]